MDELEENKFGEQRLILDGNVDMITDNKLSTYKSLKSDSIPCQITSPKLGDVGNSLEARPKSMKYIDESQRLIIESLNDENGSK
jgi:hypothetical protein